MIISVQRINLGKCMRIALFLLFFIGMASKVRFVSYALEILVEQRFPQL